MSNQNDSVAHELTEGLSQYLSEVQKECVLCNENQKTSAIHGDGKRLELYRIYERDRTASDNLHHCSNSLKSWSTLSEWKFEEQKWKKLQREVDGRTKRHKNLHPIITRGIEWEGRPILIHAYKFETDPYMKIELIPPSNNKNTYELPISQIASFLRCHEFLVPQYIAKPLPPYKRHETKFLTISEYLAKTMPKGCAATELCLSISQNTV